jgi:Tfp pilus assembly protein PilF
MKNWLIIPFSICSLAGLAQSQTDLLIDAYGTFEKQAFPEAISAFEKLIDNNRSPKSDWFLRKGIAEFRMKDFEPAAADFKRASTGNLADAYLWDARLQVTQGNAEEALQFIESYLKHADKPDLQSVQKDSFFISLHNTPGWFSLWQNDWQTDEQKVEDDASFYVKKNDFARAHSVIETGLSKGLKESTLHALNSRVYEDEGNNQLALNEINSALAIEPDNLVFMKKKAELLLKLSKYSDALNILNNILNHTPEDFDVRFCRCQAALMSDNLGLAKSDITIYLKYLKTDEAQFMASRVFFRAGSYFDALRYINPLLEKDQSNAAYFKLRGMIYYNSRTFNQAAYDLSMSLDLVPEDAEANYYLGLSQQELGNNKMACYYMQRAKHYGELRSVTFLRDNCEK